jgi:hypothetical protein
MKVLRWPQILGLCVIYPSSVLRTTDLIAVFFSSRWSTNQLDCWTISLSLCLCNCHRRRSKRDAEGGDDDDDDDDEDEEDEDEDSEEEEESEEEGAPAPSGDTLQPELSRADRKALKKQGKKKQTADEDEDEEDEDPLLANPNRAAGRMMKISDIGVGKELTRKERWDTALPLVTIC